MANWIKLTQTKQNRKNATNFYNLSYCYFSAHYIFVYNVPAQYDVVPLLTLIHPRARQVLPPPCFTQNCVGDWADLLQPSKVHFL